MTVTKTARALSMVLCAVTAAQYASSAFAAGEPVPPFFQRPYMWSEEEGRFFLRGQFGLTFTGASFPELNVPAEEEGFDGDFVSSSLFIGFEGEYRLTDHFAISAGLGYIPQETQTVSRTRELRPGEDPADFEDGQLTTEDPDGRLHFLPIASYLLWYPAPYGKIRPYLGAGYHFTQVYSGFSRMEIDPAHGWTARIGADYQVNREYGFNLDLRYYDAVHNADMRGFFPDTPGADGTGELELNPFIVTFGMHRNF